MASSAKISVSLRPTSPIGYSSDEESLSGSDEESESRSDDEAGKFDDKPDIRMRRLMTGDSSQREPFNSYRWLEPCIPFSLGQSYIAFRDHQTFDNFDSHPHQH